MSPATTTPHIGTEAALLAALATTQAAAIREDKTAGQALLFLAACLQTSMPKVARAMVDLAHATAAADTHPGVSR